MFIAVMPSTTIPSSSTPSPSPDNIGDFLLDCRYGQLESVTKFVQTFGVAALAIASDERRNNALHMCAANGHDGILAYMLSLPGLPPALLTSGNDAGNTPLHWASVNAQLACAKLLIDFQPSSSSTQGSDGARNGLDNLAERKNNVLTELRLGPSLILARNAAGHTPLGEAERNGWDEGARWLVSVMDLQPASSSASEEAGLDTNDESEVGENGDTRNERKLKDETTGVKETEDELSQLRVSDSDPPHS